jgi:hypothetical protein
LIPDVAVRDRRTHNDVVCEMRDDLLGVVGIPGIEPFLCHGESMRAVDHRTSLLGQEVYVQLAG